MMNSQDIMRLETVIVDTLRNIYDPEIPVNIYDLGLIYEVKVAETGSVYLKMTLTAPNCPMADELVEEISDKIQLIQGVTEFKLDLVFDPPWEKEMMTEEAMLELGLL